LSDVIGLSIETALVADHEIRYFDMVSSENGQEVIRHLLNLMDKGIGDVHHIYALFHLSF
jgi:hypothetical protein